MWSFTVTMEEEVGIKNERVDDHKIPEKILKNKRTMSLNNIQNSEY